LGLRGANFNHRDHEEAQADLVSANGDETMNAIEMKYEDLVPAARALSFDRLVHWLSVYENAARATPSVRRYRDFQFILQDEMVRRRNVQDMQDVVCATGGRL
jgi:hypothetical protein